MKCQLCQEDITWQQWAHAFCSAGGPSRYGNRHSITGDDRELDMRAVYLLILEEQAYARTQP